MSKSIHLEFGGYGSQKGRWLLWRGVTGCCKLSQVGAGNQTPVLWKSSKCCASLTHLSSPLLLSSSLLLFHMCTDGVGHATAHTWRSEYNFVETVFSSYLYRGSGSPCLHLWTASPFCRAIMPARDRVSARPRAHESGLVYWPVICALSLYSFPLLGPLHT